MMDNEARKDEIRRRLTLARYPKRSNAQFTDQNDHNPLVLQNCPTCHGTGHVGESSPEHSLEAEVICGTCEGSGVSDLVELYFDNGPPEAQATADAKGWLTCPNCRCRFTIHDRRAWTGRRHLRCGQKIKII